MTMKVRALTKNKIQKIQHLLTEGNLSRRRIAKKLRVSRVMVYEIAYGLKIVKQKAEPEEWEVNRTGKPFVRCPLCGAKIQMPCTLCLIRNILKHRRFERFPDEPFQPIQLELEECEQKRYEEVRAWREKLRDPNVTELPNDHPLACFHH